jgi:hypothetical protein
MARIIGMLRDDPSITAMTFKQLTFWGGLDYIVDGWYLRRGATYYHRLFRWGPGYAYATHRPPTVLDARGQDLRSQHWIDGEALAAQGIHLFHYSLLLPKQVIEKCDYYGNAAWAARPGAIAWAQESYLNLRRPFRVHNVYQHPSWLERYAGPHPEQAQQMVADLRAKGSTQLRRTDDIERLLGNPAYRVGRAALRRADPLERWARRMARRVRRAIRRIRR